MDPASLSNGLNETGQDGNFDNQKRSERVQLADEATSLIEQRLSVIASG
jgi:hypothetical protein